MRQLKIDLMDMEMAFVTRYGEITSYLDTETGEVITVIDEERRLFNRIYESYYDEQTKTVDWETAFVEERVPDWQREVLLELDAFEANFGPRYILIPPDRSHDAYRDMEAFVETVSNPRLQGRLQYAIHGRGAFRRFKDVLLDFPEERERWFQFERERLYQRIRDWLEEHGITPI
jgi:hypothetical protein